MHGGAGMIDAESAQVRPRRRITEQNNEVAPTYVPAY